MLGKVRLDVSPETPVKDLGVGKQQLVEIAKALSRNVKLLVLDEPTAALNEDDCENLFAILRELKSHGVTCVLISHKLKEVIRIADTVTVLRDGQTICTLDAHKGEVNEAVLIKQHGGPGHRQRVPAPRAFRRDGGSACGPGLERLQPEGRPCRPEGHLVHRPQGRDRRIRRAHGLGAHRAGAEHLRQSGRLSGQRRDVRQWRPRRTTTIPTTPSKTAWRTPRKTARRNGLILIQDVKQNITLANLKEISNRGIVDDNAEVKVADEYKNALNIKTPSLEQKVSNLSGGNQQKVSVAKWLFVKPKVLILDEPTRGIDVGAKYEIYKIMNRLVAQGMSIIMISSELPGDPRHERPDLRYLLGQDHRRAARGGSRPRKKSCSWRRAEEAPVTSRDLSKALRQNIRDYGMYIALVIIIVIFTITTNGLFISSRNISNLLNQAGYIAVLAVGMTLVIVIRHIDLSVGFLSGFLGAIAAVSMVYWHFPVYAVIPLVLVLGASPGSSRRSPWRGWEYRPSWRPWPAGSSTAARCCWSP